MSARTVQITVAEAVNVVDLFRREAKRLEGVGFRFIRRRRQPTDCVEQARELRATADRLWAQITHRGDAS